MKRKYIVRSIVFFLVVVLAFGSCKSKSSNNAAASPEHNAKEQFTCPMHPQIVQAKPGNCPICGMDLVPKHTPGSETEIDSSLSNLLKPVNEQVIAKIPTIKAEGGMKILTMRVQGSITYDTRVQTSIASRVSGRIERLFIKYNYQQVKKGQLIMEIYSPDLAAAQREMLFIYQHDKNDIMLQKSKQKLLLSGMQPALIQQVLNTRRIMYSVPVYSNSSGYILEKSAGNSGTSSVSMSAAASSPGSGGGMGSMGSAPSSSSIGSSPNANAGASASTPVILREGQYVNAGQSLFTVYNDKSLVAELFLNPSLAAQVKRGQKIIFSKIADQEAIFTGNIGLIQPTFRAGSDFTIARVYLKDYRLQPGELVLANIPIVYHGWWVPEAAVLVLGNRSVVFKKEGEIFKPMLVNTKLTADGMVLISDTIADWAIASNASYLVDSESFIKLSAVNNTIQ